LKRASPEWGREFLARKIRSERQNDAKAKQAIEFLVAA
jgi:hypothetical protein